MKTLEFFKKIDLEKTVLVGYYGGGNYGDELLLELFQLNFKKNGVRNVSIYYQSNNYLQYHKDFGYKICKNILTLLKSVIFSRSIVIGGGGLWGSDATMGIFWLSLGLFMMHFFGKKIYLVSVGFYSSANLIGSMSAFFAAKAADVIIARDEESALNFRRLNDKNTYLDQDISMCVELDDSVEKLYEGLSKNIKELEDCLLKNSEVTLIGFRHFRDKKKYDCVIERALSIVKDRIVVLSLFWPVFKDKDHNIFIERLVSSHRNVRVYYYACNPLELYFLFKKYRRRLTIIAPQYHLNAVAYKTGVRFFPLVYSNKVFQLMKHVGFKVDQCKWLDDIDEADIVNFVNDGTKYE